MAISTEWTTDQLLASIRRRASFPVGDEAWGDTDILSLATEAMRDYILPTIREVHEEFLVRSYDQTVSVGVTSYRLPKRVAAEALRLVMLSDGAGGFVPMSRVEPENARKLQIGFYLEDDKICLPWTPGQATTIRVKYYVRPSKLVPLASALTASSGSGAGLNIADASNGTSITSGSVCDIIRGVPGFRILDFDMVVGDLSGFPIASLNANVSEAPADYDGAFLCLAGESCVPQLPAELHSLLAQRVAVKLGEGQAVSAGYEAALRELAAMEMRARSLFAERTEGNSRVVHNFYAPGWGRSTIRRQTGS